MQLTVTPSHFQTVQCYCCCSVLDCYATRQNCWHRMTSVADTEALVASHGHPIHTASLPPVHYCLLASAGNRFGESPTGEKRIELTTDSMSNYTLSLP